MYIFWLFFVELRICNFCLRTDQTDRSESSTVVSRNVPCVFLHLGAILPPQRPRHDALLSHFVVNKLMRVRTGVCVSGWRHWCVAVDGVDLWRGASRRSSSSSMKPSNICVSTTTSNCTRSTPSTNNCSFRSINGLIDATSYYYLHYTVLCVVRLFALTAVFGLNRFELLHVTCPPPGPRLLPTGDGYCLQRVTLWVCESVRLTNDPICFK